MTDDNSDTTDSHHISLTNDLPITHQSLTNSDNHNILLSSSLSSPPQRREGDGEGVGGEEGEERATADNHHISLTNQSDNSLVPEAPHHTPLTEVSQVDARDNATSSTTTTDSQRLTFF